MKLKATLILFILLQLGLLFNYSITINRGNNSNNLKLWGVLIYSTDSCIVYERIGQYEKLVLKLYSDSVYSYKDINMHRPFCNDFSCGYWHSYINTITLESCKNKYYNILKREKNLNKSFCFNDFQAKLLKRHDSIFLIDKNNLFKSISIEDSIIGEKIRKGIFIEKKELESDSVKLNSDGIVLLIKKDSINQYEIAINHIDYITSYYPINKIFVSEKDYVKKNSLIGLTYNKMINISYSKK
jgi:hypothetical protein